MLPRALRDVYDQRMSAVVSRRYLLPRISQFSWLMGLYAENHARLQRLCVPETLVRGAYRSAVGDGMDIRLEVLERHAYTTELRLSYCLTDPETGLPDPSANLRLYHDARQLEATHCYAGHRWQDVLGLHPPAHELVNHRLRMNTFLGKWLAYLHERGHHASSFQVCDDDRDQNA